MHDRDSLSEVHDQPPHRGPRRLLIICTTPRTGSHRLAHALRDLGLGIPSEYFHENAINVLGERWKLSGDRQSPGWLDGYWQEVLRRRTRNGIVAVSIFGTQLGILKRLLADAEQPLLIHLYRHSTADQVASLLALYQTKMPYENRQAMPNIPGIAEISPRAILLLGRWIDQQNRKWREFLADKPHFATSSEAFFREPGELLRAIVPGSGVVVSPDDVDAAISRVETSAAHVTNAAIKRRLMEQHAESFAAVRPEAGRKDRRADGRVAGRKG